MEREQSAEVLREVVGTLLEGKGMADSIVIAYTYIDEDGDKMYGSRATGDVISIAGLIEFMRCMTAQDLMDVEDA